MANAKKKRKINKEFWLFIFLAVMYLIYLYFDYKNNQQLPQEPAEANGILYVHMIDCGQGDSFLFEYEGKYALIDCGTRSTGSNVVEYLKKENVDEFHNNIKSLKG